MAARRRRVNWNAVQAIGTVSALLLSALALYISWSSSSYKVVIYDPLVTSWIARGCKKGADNYGLRTDTATTLPFRNEGGAAVSFEGLQITAKFANGTQKSGSVGELFWKTPKIAERRVAFDFPVTLQSHESRRWAVIAYGITEYGVQSPTDLAKLSAGLRAEDPHISWRFQFGGAYMYALSTPVFDILDSDPEISCEKLDNPFSLSIQGT